MRMVKEIRYHQQSKRFTFNDVVDGQQTVSVRPPRFSEEDKYGAYRRKGRAMLSTKNSK